MAREDYKEIYFSFDIESDGGYPSEYSMLSIGMVACAIYDGSTFTRLDIDSSSNQFYAELKPITDKFVPAAVEICRQGGVDREKLLKEGQSPASAMTLLASWIRRVANDIRPIAFSYPSWDHQWLYDYLERFSHDNPFGFSGYIDVKSWYAGRRKALIVNSTKRNMPDKVKSNRPHTHNGLSDAIEQGEMFCNMMEEL